MRYGDAGGPPRGRPEAGMPSPAGHPGFGIREGSRLDCVDGATQSEPRRDDVRRGDPELFHLREERRALETEAHRRAAGTGNDPVGLPQHLDDALAHGALHVSPCGAGVRVLLTRASRGGSCRLPPRDRITARWRTCCSSRMFPGQEWRTSLSITSAEIESMRRPSFRA